MKNRTLIGVFAVIMSALLYGFTPVLVSYVYQMGSNAVTMSFLRNLFAVPISFLWLLLRHKTPTLPRQYLPAIFRIGILGVSATTLLLYSSYPLIGVGTATVLHFLYPLCVALIGRIFYHEHISKRRFLALVVACFGLLFFIEPGPSKGIGLFLAALSGLCYAYYIVSMDKNGLSKQDVGTVTMYLGAVVSLTVLLVGIVTNQLVWHLPPAAWALSVLISFCTSFAAVALLQLGVRYLQANTASILCLFEPISGVAFGCLLLHEPISLKKILGSGIILIALLLILKGEQQSDKTID